MEKTPRPPPPVYQPEILGEAIYLAGMVKRRDWRVGGQTTAIRAANQIAPGLLDIGAGLLGVFMQQTTREDVAARRDPNTFSASTVPAGTHGPFDRESLSCSLQWTLSKAPLPIQIGLGLLVLGVFKAALSRC